MNSLRLTTMKVALVYDRVNKWGGAERVLLALHQIFPQADLFTSVYSREKAQWAKVFKIKTSFLQNFPRANKSHELYATLMPLAFESFNFDSYDLVISVTSEAAKGIITRPSTLHICYCLTPTRYLWSGYADYFKNPILRFLATPAITYLKYWDKFACQRPDAYLAISGEVKNRIKKYYERESEVIYPPLQFPISNSQYADNIKNDYFIVVSRLTNYYKRIDLAIKACNKLRLPLKIVGEGVDKKSLQKISGSTIEFLGNLTDEELGSYYKNSKALIFPGLEDFGLVMVEAQSFGKPVIAFRGGGALDIIREGITGEFFDEQNIDSLEVVLKNFNEKRYNTLLCRENAQKFSFEHFKQNLLRFIENQSKT